MPVLDQARRYKSELLRQETDATNQLLSAYNLVTNRLQEKLNSLESEIERLVLRNELSVDKVRRLNVYVSLLNQIENEVSRYGEFANTQLQVNSDRFIELANQHTRGLTQQYFLIRPELNQAFEATWDTLPVEEIKTLLGFLQEDSPLSFSLTEALGNRAALNFQNRLIEGIALGYNPRKISAIINSALGNPLTWVLNTVRTTQLYTYRESSRANYIANQHIVSGWVWSASLDNRTCMSCIAKHGSIHEVTESLNDHHSGRCSQIPLIQEKFGLEQVQISSGESWFNNLPVTEQEQRMGIGKFELWRRGGFNFEELSTPYQNDIFGEMLRETTLQELLRRGT